jgi:hypothetical protein
MSKKKNKNTEKKKKNTIPYRDINDLPEDDWVLNLGPIIIYSTPTTIKKSNKDDKKENV